MSSWQMIDHVRTKAHSSDEVTELEVKNQEISRMAAEEAVVLLENDGVLPLCREEKIALFGIGATNTVKGGSGSGEVNERSSISLYEALQKEGIAVTTEELLHTYHAAEAKHREEYIQQQQKKAGFLNFGVTMANLSAPYFCMDFPKLEEEDLDGEARVCVYVISRVSGESYDRKCEKGDYFLSDLEVENLRKCAAKYEKLILIINAGGPIDLCAVDDISFSAVIYMSMLGGAGGAAVVNILFGKVSPSGHLSATWPLRYEDIPFANEYSYLNGDMDQEYYREGIYVGYRYFESFGIPVRYAFGRGLSYTTFASECTGFELPDRQADKMWNADSRMKLSVRVKNTGALPGKQVVQVYADLPQTGMEKEKRRLTGFAKTELLNPGESETVAIEIPFSNLASYAVNEAAFQLEQGQYVLSVGETVDAVSPIAVLHVTNRIELSKHIHICPVRKDFDELSRPMQKPDGNDLAGLPTVSVSQADIETRSFRYGEPAAPADEKANALLQKLKTEELADIVVGCGNDMLMPMKHHYTVPGASGYTTNKYLDRGVFDAVLCDGPAGVRLQQQAVAVKGKNLTKGITSSIETLLYLPKAVKLLAFGKPSDGTVLYQYTTAFPVGTAMAQTWNEKLVKTVGQAVNRELEEYGINFWLGPGMNIHRNPLCGRNYEYFSEDPLLSGKIGAAMARGAQCQGNHYVTIKHFAGNNQETNRGNVSSNIKVRALREIYLRGFEVAIKEGGAGAVMTSYNRVNGVYSAANHDLVTKVLRNEWGFDGVVMTDWDTPKPDCTGEDAVASGVDLQMAGTGKQSKQIRAALKKGTLPEARLKCSALRVLKAIAKNE